MTDAYFDVVVAVGVQTRDVFKHCAKLLFSIRIGQMSGCEQLLADASENIRQSLELAGTHVQLRDGRLSTAIEELTKTKLLLQYVGKLTTHNEYCQHVPTFTTQCLSWQILQVRKAGKA